MTVGPVLDRRGGLLDDLGASSQSLAQLPYAARRSPLRRDAAAAGCSRRSAFTLLYALVPARRVPLAPRAGRRAVRRARLRGRQARLRPLHHHGADLPDRLRRAGGAAAVPALDLRVLADRAGRRGGDGDADRRSAAPPRAGAGASVALRRSARGRRQRAPCRIAAGRLHFGGFASTESSHRVVHHSSGRLADLAADRRLDHRAGADLRAAVVAAAERRRAAGPGRPRAGRVPAGAARRRSCSRRTARAGRRSAASSPPGSPTSRARGR